MRRWRTRPSCQTTVIAVEPEPEKDGWLFRTMREEDEQRQDSEEDEVEEHADEITTLLSIFQKPGIRRRPADRNLDDQIKEEEAKLLREQEKAAFELKQAEDFSLCIEEEGTGKRLYIEADGNVVDYDAVKREECKRKLEEELAEQRRRLEDLREIRKSREQQPKRKAISVQKPKKKKKPHKAAKEMPPQIVEEVSLERIVESPIEQKSKRSSKKSVTFNRISLAYSPEPSTAKQIVTQVDFDPESSEDAEKSYDIGANEETELGPKTSQESLFESGPSQSEDISDVAVENHRLTCPSTSNTVVVPENSRKSLSALPKRLSQLPFSPIQRSTLPDHSPKGAATSIFTSTPIGSKAFTTSTPLTSNISQPLFLFDTDEENTTDKENGPTIQYEESKTARKKSERLSTFAATTINFTLGDSTANFNNTAASVIKNRNFTQIVSFYDKDTNRKRSLYYLKDYSGDKTDSNAYDHLLHLTKQLRPMKWSELKINKVLKLGEGTYGEVFATNYGKLPSAVKIFPFNNDVWRYEGEVNKEKLMEPVEVLPEILITTAVGKLKEHERNNTQNFIEVYGAHVIQGKYPKKFLDAWDDYEEKKTSLNDRPTVYDSKTQLFLAIFLSKGGTDLESVTLENESQVISIFLQVTLSLIVAELELEFEHRDLHWGNILVDECDEAIKYKYEGHDLSIESHGVKANIIDFTLSRMSKHGTILYKDLTKDEELFEGAGLTFPKDEDLGERQRSYQFDIYRMMKEIIGDEWTQFSSRTNVLWGHYLIRQMLMEKECKNPIPNERKIKLMTIFDRLLEADDLRVIFTDERLQEVVSPYLIVGK